MPQSIRRCLLTSLVALVLGGEPLRAQGRVASTLWSASEVLEAFQGLHLKSIPSALLSNAQGIAIIPHVLKGGFLVGGRLGHGVVLARNPDGSWGQPVFVTLAGASIGWQAGVQSTDVILVFKTRKSLERILQGKGKLTLGADAAVAAGPLGRQAEASTDPLLQAEIYSYSRSRGLFAGLSLEGAVITNDAEANRAYMLRARPEDLLAVERLQAQLAAMSVPRAPILGLPQPVLPPPGAPLPPAPAPAPFSPVPPGFAPLPPAPRPN